MGPVDQYSKYPGAADDDHFGIPKDTMDSFDGTSFVWTWKESLLVIPLGIIVLGTIFGNLLVLYASVTRSQNLRLPTHYFIANLAIADFLVGVLVMPFLTTLQLTGKWYFGPVYCEAWTVIHFWLCSASILSTCAVCIERYVGVRYPLQHKDIMNSRRITGMIACVWSLAGFLTLTSLYIWPEPKSELPLDCKINQQIGHVIVAVVGILYIPATVMIILYWKIYMIASKHLKFIKRNSVAPTPSQQNGSSPNKRVSNGLTIIPETSTTDTSFSSSSVEGDEGKSRQGEKKDSALSTSTTTSSSVSGEPLMKNVQKKQQINLARRLSVLVGVLLASYLPFFTLYMVMAFHPGSINLHVFLFFGWIRYFNSCLNPCIYAFAVPAYRKAMKDIVRNAIGKKR